MKRSDFYNFYGYGFYVSIRHNIKEPNQWYLSVSLHENHLLYNEFKSVSKKYSYQNNLVDAAYLRKRLGLEMHGGITFLYREKIDGRKYITFGCDYQHCDDKQFGEMSNEKDAKEIFNHARQLFDFFNNYTGETK